ncbi:type II toxin-antitoxin system RelE/ParE family toxin [Candidatus Daviesbacteria bacterium]|nr:type II toxin-antitoxin system RelE/ParE family toxin [Candidatus Daviesbacteria bacterium]
MVQVIFTKTAEKSFLKLPVAAKKKIAKAIEKLASNPLAGEKLKGEFAGQYKLYAWPYRVIYIFSTKENILTVVEVEHRQGVYK